MVMPTAVAGVDQGPKRVKRVKTRDQHTGQLASKDRQRHNRVCHPSLVTFLPFSLNMLNNETSYATKNFPKNKFGKVDFPKLSQFVHFEIRDKSRYH